MNAPFRFDDPDVALLALAERLTAVSETLTGGRPGQVLAEDVTADRDSPAADVSAMDGFAVRLSDLVPDVDLPLAGESKAGSPPPPMTAGAVMRVFTGAMVPDAAEAVIKREDTVESSGSIRLTAETIDATRAGAHIRRQGENTPAGSVVLPSGTFITPAVTAALANFGIGDPKVFAPVRVAVLTTGNEVLDPSTPSLHPWQLRNSNRAVLEALLDPLKHARLDLVEHVDDEPSAMNAALGRAAEQADVVLLTGGVSKGDYDYVPDAVGSIGAEVVFHGLPIRPGKPILAAATGDGKLILGLPGNPVSAAINCHRFGLPLIAKMAGNRAWNTPPPLVSLVNAPPRPIPLHTMPLVQLTETGTAQPVPSKGSGDLVAMAKSDGYVSMLPNATHAGPWPLFRW